MVLGLPNDFQLVIFHLQRKKKREKSKPSSFPLSTLQSVKIMVQVIGWKILHVRDLQTSSSPLGIYIRTSKSRYEYCIFRSIVIKVFFPFYFTTVDLEIPQDKCMHPTRSKNMEWRNLQFPTTSIKALGQVIACQIYSKVC